MVPNEYISMLRGLAKATGVTLGVATGLAVVTVGGYAVYSPQNRRNLDFAKRALSMYGAYRFEEWRTKGLSERDRDEAFVKLHAKWAPIAIEDILHLRGLYIKLGQMMTTRADYAPPTFMKALSVLEDAVPARPFAEIAEGVRRELGVDSLNEVFLSIEEKPLGAATIGQVHGAVLLNGDRVVIKVQYPEVEKLFTQDLKAVATFCRLLQPEFTPMMEEMERAFKTEFDFAREGWAMEQIREGVMQRFGNKVRVPKPYREYCTRRVCVMERFDGVKLVDGFKRFYRELAQRQGMTLEEMMAQQEKLGRQPVTETRLQLYRGALKLYNWIAIIYNWTLGLVLPQMEKRTVPPNHIRIIDLLAEVHGYEIFELGTFNGDPHPGNIWLMDDGSLGLIDYGQVSQLTPHHKRELAKLILAIASDDSERIRKQFIEFGFRTERMDLWIIERTARYYFEDDTNPKLLTRKDGSLMNMQQVMEYMYQEDKTTYFPEFSFLVVRCAMLIRGLATHFGIGVNIARRWEPYARDALASTDYLEKKD